MALIYIRRPFGMRKVLFTFFAILLSVVLSAEYLMVDDLGRLVPFEGEVNRSVAAAPAVSDYIKYLGLEEKVVGVTDCDTTIDS
jgi:iron complex transport system substrate-binding protein